MQTMKISIKSNQIAECSERKISPINIFFPCLKVLLNRKLEPILMFCNYELKGPVFLEIILSYNIIY